MYTHFEIDRILDSMTVLVDTREQDVLNAIQETFQVIERREEKGWVAMALKLK